MPLSSCVPIHPARRKPKLAHVINRPTTCPSTLLPLGAIMLAASMSSWAEENTLKPVIVKDTYDRAAQTYQSGVTSTAKTPVAAKDVPQSLTVVNEKLIHDQ